jgi:mono/diheme cytochrome c family protein
MKFLRSGSALVVFGTVLGSCFALAADAAKPGGKPAAKAAAPAPKPQGDTYQRQIAPLVKKYCGACHGPNNQIAGINFQTYKDEASVAKGRTVWEKAAKNVEAGHMPPKNAPQPSAAEKQRILGWIGATLAKIDCDLRDPGRVTMRRLNRAEYNNTVRDLVGVDFRPADDFPSDDVGYGFDNIGDVLTISPILMEKYLAAAEKIVDRAIVSSDPKAARFQAERLGETGGAGVINDSARNLVSNGEVFVDYSFPRDGEYVIRARAWGQQAGPDPARMAFLLEGKELETVDVAAKEDAPKVYEKRVQVQAGKRRVAVAFTNDYYMPKDPDRNNRDRNLLVDYVEIAGPLGAKPANLTESHKRIFITEPVAGKEDEAARKILGSFARRAYRRPVAAAEVERLVKITRLAKKEGDSFEKGIGLALQAVLVSPHFLFRVELDPAGQDPHKPRNLNDYELASRLSYFLWSSMPDEELFSLAEKGTLKNPAVLEAQAVRMLKDPRSRALVENFGGQWLQLRNLQTISPDPARFPQFSNDLRKSMQKETELFFEAIVREDRSVLDFLDGKFTFLNERLAKHYGIDGVQGDNFRRVELTGDQRGGVLRQASILTITSNPTRTSPVKRGKWVLEQILGTPPPPPPPDVPELKEEPEQMLTGTLRQRLEQHRKDPICASCHSRMDPIGFGLENYDAIGAWRSQEGKFSVDPSGTLPDGKSFKGPADLIAIIKDKKELFARNLTEQMLTYALGRGLEHYDRCSVDVMAGRAGRKGYRFSALVTEIVKCEPFRLRKGDGGERE